MIILHLILRNEITNYRKDNKADCDEELFDAAGILEYEMVCIVDINNGQRFETYVIAGERGSGLICLNGAAARCVQVNDKIIIMAYSRLTPEEAEKHRPSVVFVDNHNHIVRKTNVPIRK
ncbi:L-aspartate 1-decarboxylase [Anaerocolumna jejuensis DSM 15929]|uniref:Aspartate 1-decarboxylase n=1 Tax=Anaerocolumna jejuensis DSM 15929 TaxID=1121322 RepID=A0A1M6VPA3_9FIRM|nr:L-aspartate 1-decarboxylase [Anaerocolumna jejuensis DSM 15929]